MTSWQNTGKLKLLDIETRSHQPKRVPVGDGRLSMHVRCPLLYFVSKTYLYNAALIVQEFMPGHVVVEHGKLAKDLQPISRMITFLLTGKCRTQNIKSKINQLYLR